MFRVVYEIGCWCGIVHPCELKLRDVYVFRNAIAGTAVMPLLTQQ